MRVRARAQPRVASSLERERGGRDVDHRNETVDPRCGGDEDAVIAAADDGDRVAPSVVVAARRRQRDVDRERPRPLRETNEWPAVRLATEQRVHHPSAYERGQRAAARDRRPRPGHEQTDGAALLEASGIELRNDEDGDPPGLCRARGYQHGDPQRDGYESGVPLRQGADSLVKRKAYGRDAGLSLRMLGTSFTLGLLYVVFAVVLFQVLNVGLIPMLLIVVGIAVFQYYTSDKLALAAAGAKIVSREQAPALHDMVERLCALADLPKPKVAIMDTPVPNAFATGRSPKHAAVCVTTGLWDRLEPKEVEGVLAHELSHIANRDVLVMTIASFFAMLAALLTRFGLYSGMWG